MIRALKVIMVILGLILVLEGLADIAMPAQRAQLMGPVENSRVVEFYLTVLGATWVAAGLWAVAAARDPLRHVSWIKFAITLLVLLSGALLYSAARGYVSFGQVAIEVGLDVVLAAALFAFYPRRAVSGSR